MVDIGKIEEKTDEELVSLTLKDQDYFMYLLKRYESRLLKYIMRISNISYEEAEDILQEVFIKTYRNLNEFDTSLKFSSWIYRITYNQVISNYRKDKARKKNVIWDIEDDVLDRIAADFDVNQEIDLNLLKTKIASILGELDKKYKEVLVLRFWEEKDYQEIADILKKPIGTVATLISRAKKIFIKVVNKQNIKL